MVFTQKLPNLQEIVCDELKNQEEKTYHRPINNGDLEVVGQRL